MIRTSLDPTINALATLLILASIGCDRHCACVSAAIAARAVDLANDRRWATPCDCARGRARSVFHSRIMAYKSSPRPTFDRPTHIPYAGVTRYLWGDDESGKVDDWIYVSSAKIHELVFGLPPGAAFRHSTEFRTVFGADEVLYVLEGTYISANPETGEVHVANEGEAIFFRKDTWHHGFNGGTGPVRVLEFFAPPPSTGTSGAYARTQALCRQAAFMAAMTGLAACQWKPTRSPRPTQCASCAIMTSSGAWKGRGSNCRSVFIAPPSI